MQVKVLLAPPVSHVIFKDFFCYLSAYEDSFRMQIQFTYLRYCIKNIRNRKWNTTFVRTPRSCDDDTKSYRWIWTNFAQILNWETLGCMTDDYHSVGGDNFVTIKKCDPNDGLQRWICVGDEKYNIIQTQSGRYLNYGDFQNYVTTNKRDSEKWTRRGTGTQKDVCAKGSIHRKILSKLNIINKPGKEIRSKRRIRFVKNLANAWLDYIHYSVRTSRNDLNPVLLCPPTEKL